MVHVTFLEQSIVPYKICSDKTIEKQKKYFGICYVKDKICIQYNDKTKIWNLVFKVEKNHTQKRYYLMEDIQKYIRGALTESNSQSVMREFLKIHKIGKVIVYAFFDKTKNICNGFVRVRYNQKPLDIEKSCITEKEFNDQGGLKNCFYNLNKEQKNKSKKYPKYNRLCQDNCFIDVLAYKPGETKSPSFFRMHIKHEYVN